MSRITAQLSISADGFAAGPNQSLEHPLGEGGMALHEWMLATRTWNAMHGLDGGVQNADDDIARTLFDGVGAYVMGRRMFGGGEGEWDLDWRGWWGDEPPYHVPVFVLTHHERAPLEMEGGTTFTFVTGGLDAALEQAAAAAGTGDVQIAGGASTVRQVLAAGRLDELFLHIAPLTLGAGERLLEDVGGVRFEPLEVVGTAAATHVRYRVLGRGA